MEIKDYKWHRTIFGFLEVIGFTAKIIIQKHSEDNQNVIQYIWMVSTSGRVAWRNCVTWELTDDTELRDLQGCKKGVTVNDPSTDL